MLCLSRKTEYALVALAHLAERPGLTASAREIARVHALPLPLLMNLLKVLQAHEVLRSTRGVKGGYQIVADLDRLCLYALIKIVECPGHGPGGECGCLAPVRDLPRRRGTPRAGEADRAELPGPVQALQSKLTRFLMEVRVADLVTPGRRIDVPVERLVTSCRPNSASVNRPPHPHPEPVGANCQGE